MIRSLLLLAALAASILVASSDARAEIRVSRFDFETYDIRDGLSQNTITCLLQDSRGYLWAGTQSGLNRFDGIRFTPFSHQNTDANGLPNSYVLSLIETQDESLWIGTFNGFARFDPVTETFTQWVPGPETRLRGARIRALAEGPDGRVWIGTETGGLHWIDPGSAEVVPFEGAGDWPELGAHGSVVELAVDHDGHVWIGSEHGLFVWRDGAFGPKRVPIGDATVDRKSVV